MAKNDNDDCNDLRKCIYTVGKTLYPSVLTITLYQMISQNGKVIEELRTRSERLRLERVRGTRGINGTITSRRISKESTNILIHLLYHRQ